MEIRVRVPEVASVEKAIEVYNNRTILYSRDILELFPSIRSMTTAAKLKKLARAYAEEHGVVSYNDQAVDTDSAYKAWGLDIQSLRRRYAAACKMMQETSGRSSVS